jgi:hypothetical protein
MSKVICTVFAAVVAPFLVMLSAAASFADPLTKVTCHAPVSEVATGQGIGALAPRITFVCTRGSSAGNITYFAFRLSDNPTVAQLLEAQLGPYLQTHGTNAAITILSDLSDTSGASWGCGAANCRIIAYMYGD